ncbi:MAG TPA: S9 family peptidase [Terriglobales bacterium]|nr:S9 family peptidase [Terriglobales bacterium]
MRRLLLALVLTSIALSGSPFAQSKRPFTFEDMMQLRRISDPQVSPDGKWVMFSAQDVNLDANTKTNHLWIVPLAGGEAKPLTSGASGEDRGRFSPDGKKVAYLSSRDGGTQVWVQDFDGANGQLSGDPKRITNISTEADGELWSGDGKYIVFASSVYPDCPDDACNQKRDAEKSASKVKAQIFTHLMYRHWNRYLSSKRSHLFAIAADGSGDAKDLTPGDHDVPPFNLGGQDFYAISPDGQEIAYTSNLEKDEATSTNNDVFVIPITGGQPKKISTSPGSDSNPAYSPDGRCIAYRMQERNGYESDLFHLVIYDRKSGTRKNLTPKFDNWVESFAWSPDSKKIYFTADKQGGAPVYSVNADGGEIKEILGGHNDELSVTPDGKTVVFTRQTAQFPNEVFSATIDSQRATKLSKLNDKVFAQVQTSPVESFWFTGAENAKVQGFIVKPPNFSAAEKYPVKFLIHGGPQGAWGDSWTYRWNAQLFAANGYVVVMINPRGSVGYGQRFTEEVSGDWGGRAYVDLMRGLDHVQALPYVQKENVCAMGASYGGYAVNWIITHTTRFKCAVSHDGMFNTESAWGTTEELWFNEWEFKGTPWTNREMYRRWSPHLSVTNIKTPTLVVHGQLDYRLDASEGFQLFTTLQRLGVPSKMLYFPDEGHWVLKPQNSRLWYQTVNGWVDQWLKGTAPNAVRK